MPTASAARPAAATPIWSGCAHGKLEAAPDAVIVPSSDEAVEALLAACAEAGVAVVPFGGGSSVVGGLDAVDGGHSAVVSLDMTALRAVDLDRTSLTARLGPGLRGPEAEAALGGLGHTIGHFPQSFEQATIGGMAATRSAGQASSGYGRFDELVTAMELTTPSGAAADPPDAPHGRWARPARAGARLRGHPGRDHRRHLPRPARPRGAPLRGLDGRRLARRPRDHPRARPARRGARRPAPLRRGGDPRLAPALRGRGPPEEGARRLPRAPPPLARAACSSAAGRASTSRSAAAGALGHRRLRAGGAVPLGQAAGRSWEKGRFEGPYLRDELLGMGVFVETLETSHTWSRLDELYVAVGGALQGRPRSAVDRHVPPLPRLSRRSLALLHIPGPLPAAGPEARSSSGARPRPPPARRSSPPGARSPTTTRWAATTPRT